MNYLYSKYLRKWLEQTTKKQIMNNPVFIGYKNGRKVYSIDFTDGTSEDFFINYDKQYIEKI